MFLEVPTIFAEFQYNFSLANVMIKILHDERKRE